MGQICLRRERRIGPMLKMLQSLFVNTVATLFLNTVCVLTPRSVFSHGMS